MTFYSLTLPWHLTVLLFHDILSDILQSYSSYSLTLPWHLTVLLFPDILQSYFPMTSYSLTLLWHLTVLLFPRVGRSSFREAVRLQEEPHHLVRFETFIRNALTIFFDLEKAYDTTWKHSILADLWDLGFRGPLPRFIQIFLSERSFRVRVGSTLSELHEQEMGSHKVASCLRPFSALKLTLLKLS